MTDAITVPAKPKPIDFIKSFFFSFFPNWWAEQGSNLRPIACRAIALPAELSAL